MTALFPACVVRDELVTVVNTSDVHPGVQPKDEVSIRKESSPLVKASESIRSSLSTRRRSDSPANIETVSVSPAQEVQLLTILNDGSPDDIRSLKGMGPKSVEAVLQYRNQGGKILCIDDLDRKSVV